jgi:hypothetical protein
MTTYDTEKSIFQRILVASEIEEAVINTLQMWFPTYLREMERQLGLAKGTLSAPVNYTNRNSFDAEVGEKDLPKVVVVSPGLADTPLPQGQGRYRAIWRLGIGVAVSASTEQLANMLTKSYGATVRAIILQQQQLDESIPGVVEITWIEESYDDLDIPDQIMLYKAAAIYFHIDVENVVSKWAGPEPPPPTDKYIYGEVQEVDIALDKEATT